MSVTYLFSGKSLLSFLLPTYMILTFLVFYDRYAYFNKVRRALNIDNLKKFWRNRYEVYVCVYKLKQNALRFCIGCCEADKRREMDKKMEFNMFNVVIFFTKRMTHETMLLIEFSGLYTIADYEELHFLE